MHNKHRRADSVHQPILIDQPFQHNSTPKAARGIDSLRSALGITQEEASPDALATIYINSERDGYCGMCGVDSVAGPGAAGCQVTDSCQELSTPFGGGAGKSAAAVVE